MSMNLPSLWVVLPFLVVQCRVRGVNLGPVRPNVQSRQVVSFLSPVLMHMFIVLVVPPSALHLERRHGTCELKSLGLRKFDIGGHAINRIVSHRCEPGSSEQCRRDNCMLLFASVFASQATNGDLLNESFRINSDQCLVQIQTGSAALPKLIIVEVVSRGTRWSGTFPTFDEGWSSSCKTLRSAGR